MQSNVHTSNSGIGETEHDASVSHCESVLLLPTRELNFSIFEKRPEFVSYAVNLKYCSARNYGNEDQNV
ncbi:hypothetical protein GCM10011343_09760 [Flavobacterium orientale]|uniref:Uncharacterized protein n=1 Tax=Flavobacterium orientale TaxID=1756020 RepID=A0A917DAR5_9FLAO|nr:hypothetical protein GCM10011343_09760 [Flavobacterium orientale]